MWLIVLENVLLILIAYGLLRWAYRSWNKAGVENKADQLEDLDLQYNTVQEATKKYKDIEEKRNAIKKFKNQ